MGRAFNEILGRGNPIRDGGGSAARNQNLLNQGAFGPISNSSSTVLNNNGSNGGGSNSDARVVVQGEEISKGRRF